MSDYIDTEDFEGPLQKIFADALGFIMRNLHKVQAGRGVNAPGLPEIPESVFEELLVNALVHRDYLVNAPIRLFIYDNRIEIISPGHLPNNLTVEKIRNGNSNIRNPILVSYVAKGLLPYHGLGSGIKRALEQWPEIEFSDDHDGCLFRVTVTRNPVEDLDLAEADAPGSAKDAPEAASLKDRSVNLSGHNDPIADLLNKIQESPNADYASLARDLRVSEATVKRNIQKLMQKNRIRRVGSKKQAVGKSSNEKIMNLQILLQSRKNNLILVGEPGVGKTGIVEGFAQLLAEGKLPDALGRPTVRRVDIPVRQANGWRKKSGFCHWTFASHWHLGETPTLLEAGSASGSMGAANILKPALARGAIRVIGATTIQEYRQTIEKDGALERRFQAVRIEEPSADEAVAILLALRPRLEAHHGVALDEVALRAAVEWSVRYLPDFRLPDKALDLVDQACAAVRFRTLTPEVEEIPSGETPLARPAARRSSHVVGREEIAAAVAARCGIPVGTLTADEGARLMALEGDLGKRVKGQPEAISAVADAVRLARAELKKPGRPVGVFLFVGPSGTGKTELAKTLAENLFHDERRLIRFDMSEFMEEHSVAKLIGAPPGYVGHDEGGQLRDAIRTHPYSVVLFDEIEKAHPRVLDLFLQIFDEGTLTDAQRRKCDFRESVIILTSNLGSEVVKKRRMGFGVEEEEHRQDACAPVEEAMLSGKIKASQTIRLEANGDQIQFQQ